MPNRNGQHTPEMVVSDRGIRNWEKFIGVTPMKSPTHALDGMPRVLSSRSNTLSPSLKRQLLALDDGSRKALLAMGMPKRAFEKGGAFDAENDDLDENDGDGDMEKSFQELWNFMVLNAPSEARDLMRDFVSKAGLSDKLNVAEPDDDGETAGDNYSPMPPGRRVALRAQAGDRRLASDSRARLLEADREGFNKRWPQAAHIKVLG